MKFLLLVYDMFSLLYDNMKGTRENKLLCPETFLSVLKVSKLKRKAEQLSINSPLFLRVLLSNLQTDLQPRILTCDIQ